MKQKLGIIEGSMRHNKLMLFIVFVLCVFGIFALVKNTKTGISDFYCTPGSDCWRVPWGNLSTNRGTISQTP